MGLYDSYAYVHLGAHKKNVRYCNQRIKFLLAKLKTSLSYARVICLHTSAQMSLGLLARVSAQGGYSEFQVTGVIEWRQKTKPQKIPRASNKAQKKPCTKN